MPKLPEQAPEPKEPDSEKLKPETQPDISESEVKETLKAEIEGPEETEKELEKLEAEVEKAFDKGELLESDEGKEAEVRKEKIKRYQEKYLPKHLRERAGVVSQILINFLAKQSKSETEGKENVPEKGPFIVVCNHFGGGGDVYAIIKTFRDYDLHFALAKNMLWNKNPIIRWFFKKMRTIPIEESLSNISEQEKEDALKRQEKRGKAVFRKIIDKEKNGQVAMNVEFVRQAVAALSRGDSLGIFPEGLWLNPEYTKFGTREKEEMKQGYRGVELVVSEYKKLTGEDLPIVPTAFNEDMTTGKEEFVIGDQLSLEDNDSDLSDTDWVMAHIARMLPEEKRGYYKELVEKIN